MSDEKSELLPDEAVIVGHSSEGTHIVRRHPDGRLEGGVVSQAQEGKPIHGEIVNLKSIGGRRFAVETVYRAGPPKVSTAAYRSGWEATFGKRAHPTESN